MAFLRRPDEFVVRAVKSLDHRLEPRHVPLHQLAGRELLFGGGLQHLHAVLIRTGQEEHFITLKPHEPGYGISRNRLIGVPDMRRAVGIGNGRGDVIARFVRHWSVRRRPSCIPGPDSQLGYGTPLLRDRPLSSARHLQVTTPPCDSTGRKAGQEQAVSCDHS